MAKGNFLLDLSGLWESRVLTAMLMKNYLLLEYDAMQTTVSAASELLKT
jgi:hypothetical protein